MPAASAVNTSYSLTFNDSCGTGVSICQTLRLRPASAGILDGTPWVTASRPAGVLLLLLHPQAHQAANEETLAAVDAALEQLAAIPGVWKARPDEIVDWVTAPER